MPARRLARNYKKRPSGPGRVKQGPSGGARAPGYLAQPGSGALGERKRIYKKLAQRRRSTVRKTGI